MSRAEHAQRPRPHLDGDLDSLPGEDLTVGVDGEPGLRAEREGREARRAHLGRAEVAAMHGAGEEPERPPHGDRPSDEAEVQPPVIDAGVRGEAEAAANGRAVVGRDEEERPAMEGAAGQWAERAVGSEGLGPSVGLDHDLRLRPPREAHEDGGEVGALPAKALEAARRIRRERVEPDADGVDEDALAPDVLPGRAPADAAHIHRDRLGGQQGLNGSLGRLRDAEQLREVVAGAEREQAQRSAVGVADEAGGDLLQRPVAPGGHDDVERRGRLAGEVRRVPGPLGLDDLEGHAGALEHAPEVGALAPGAAVPSGWVEDDGVGADGHLANGFTATREGTGGGVSGRRPYLSAAMPAPRLLLVLLLLLTACADPAPPPSGAQTVTDDLDRTVRIAQPVRRVLSLAPNLTELLFAAGAGDRLIAASQADTYPPGLDTLPQFSSFPLDVERVVALQPDLVLGHAAINDPATSRALDVAGIPLYFFSFETLGDVPRTLRTLGGLLGTEATANAAADSIEAQLERLAARTADGGRPRVLLLISDETLYAFGGASYTQELIRIAGGESITASFEGEGVTLSEEFVLEAQPEVIVGAFGPDYDPRRLVERHPAFRALPAVRNGRVYGIDPDLIERPGPRIVEGAEALARVFGAEKDERAEGSLPSSTLPRPAR